jgi:hypothetical protein
MRKFIQKQRQHKYVVTVRNILVFAILCCSVCMLPVVLLGIRPAPLHREQAEETPITTATTAATATSLHAPDTEIDADYLHSPEAQQGKQRSQFLLDRLRSSKQSPPGTTANNVARSGSGAQGRFLNLLLSGGSRVHLILPPQKVTRARTLSTDTMAMLVPTMCATNNGKYCTLLRCSNYTSPASGFRIQHSDMTKSSLVQQHQPHGCVVSHKYQFVYVHVLKSGGMSVKTFLKTALCGSTKLPCEQGPDVIQVGTCTSALRNYPAYFVWSVVRDPYARLYSAYAMAMTMLRRSRANDKDLPFSSLNAQHLSGTNRRRLLSAIRGHANYTFHDFVLHSENRKSYSSLDRAHYYPQTRFLFDRNECPLVDYIARLEHLDQDLPVLLERLGSPELTDYVRQRNGSLGHQMDTAYGHKKRETDRKSLREYFSEEMYQSATAEFESDFRLLGFNEHAIQD